MVRQEETPTNKDKGLQGGRYARTEEEAIDVLEDAARGTLEITSLAEESRPPAHAADEAH